MRHLQTLTSLQVALRQEQAEHLALQLNLEAVRTSSVFSDHIFNPYGFGMSSRCSFEGCQIAELEAYE